MWFFFCLTFRCLHERKKNVYIGVRWKKRFSLLLLCTRCFGTHQRECRMSMFPSLPRTHTFQTPPKISQTKKFFLLLHVFRVHDTNIYSSSSINHMYMIYAYIYSFAASTCLRTKRKTEQQAREEEEEEQNCRVLYIPSYNFPITFDLLGYRFYYRARYGIFLCCCYWCSFHAFASDIFLSVYLDCFSTRSFALSMSLALVHLHKNNRSSYEIMWKFSWMNTIAW